MNKLIIGFLINCFWALGLLSQRLCTNQPPNDRDPSSCCMRLPNPIDPVLSHICSANYSKNTQRQQQEARANEMPKGNCVSECIANQTKIYYGNGLIDRITLARLFLNSVSGDREWANIITGAVDTCINETRIKADELRQSSNINASFVGEMICHPISGYLLGCMNTELFKRCPNTTQSAECNALQQYAMNCHIPAKYN